MEDRGGMILLKDPSRIAFEAGDPTLCSCVTQSHITLDKYTHTLHNNDDDEDDMIDKIE